MRFDKEHWKELDINVDSLWFIGPRAKGGKHSNAYHGNFVPQIPNQMIRRYTDEGDVVLDLFMGSGTTLYECESLNRHYIGFDINQEIIDMVKEKMNDCENIHFYIHNCDVTQNKPFKECINQDLKFMRKKKVDLVIAHPPYFNIVKFTDKKEDLSNINELPLFIQEFKTSIKNALTFLKNKKHFVLVIGDLWQNEEVVPLGFYLMQTIIESFRCKLKGIVIKDIIGNRAKIGQEGLWKYRALKNGNYLFKHEYLFVFRKEGDYEQN